MAANNERLMRWLFVAFFIPLSLGCAGGATANTSSQKNPPVIATRQGSQFAFADFDGDRSPDSASVEPSNSSPANTKYSIELQLSQEGQQSIQLLAPGGGLTIKARDVNGDDAVDLVLATAWFRQPVAVFLNDGHGGFSQAASGAYAWAFNEDDKSWAAAAGQATDLAGAPPQQSTDADASRATTRRSANKTRFAAQSATKFHSDALMLSQPGRAPPVLFLL